jgi:hypothetical protein
MAVCPWDRSDCPFVCAVIVGFLRRGNERATSDPRAVFVGSYECSPDWESNKNMVRFGRWRNVMPLPRLLGVNYLTGLASDGSGLRQEQRSWNATGREPRAVHKDPV